mgnify:CR=1 FL=1
MPLMDNASKLEIKNTSKLESKFVFGGIFKGLHPQYWVVSIKNAKKLISCIYQTKIETWKKDTVI